MPLLVTKFPVTLFYVIVQDKLPFLKNYALVVKISKYERIAFQKIIIFTVIPFYNLFTIYYNYQPMQIQQ